MGDGTELKRQHLEAATLDLDDGTRVVLAPWPQGDKARGRNNQRTCLQAGSFMSGGIWRVAQCVHCRQDGDAKTGSTRTPIN